MKHLIPFKPSIITLFLVIFIPPLLSAQKVKIVQVIEPTLFVLNTFEHIRLANIKLPDCSSTDPGLQALRRYGLHFVKDHYRKKWFKIQYSGQVDSAGIPLVHLTQKYPLNTFYLSAALLRHGYGWYVNNADSLYQKNYRRAGLEAKKRKRGVWNPQKYLLSGFADYSIQLLGGYIDPEYDGPHQVLNDYTLRLVPADHRTGLEVSANLYSVRETTRFCCDCTYWPGEIQPMETETRTFYDYVFSFRGLIVGQYSGFTIGMNFITTGNQFCSEGSELIVFPTAELKFGLMQKAFFSVSFADYYRRSLATYGINYIFNNPLNRIWLGFGTADDHRQYGFELQLNPWGHLLLMTQGGYFKEEYQNRLGGRIGLGWVLR